MKIFIAFAVGWFFFLSFTCLSHSKRGWISLFDGTQITEGGEECHHFQHKDGCIKVNDQLRTSIMMTGEEAHFQELEFKAEVKTLPAPIPVLFSYQPPTGQPDRIRSAGQ